MLGDNRLPAMTPKHDVIQSVVFTTLILILSAAVQSAGYRQAILTSDTQDKSVQSPGHPGPYSGGVNITWYWRTSTRGQWAVVFFDFVLDRDPVRDMDYLQIMEGDRLLRYSNATPPPRDIISHGPELSMNFISDRTTNPASIGFRALVMFGKSLDDLNRRILEARELEQQKNEDVEGDNEGENTTMIISSSIIVSVVVVIFIIVIVWVSLRRHRDRKDEFNIPATPRIRRDSGLSYTRNENVPQQEIIENDLNQQQQQSQQQQQQQPQRQRSVSSTAQRQPQLQHSISSASQRQPQLQRSFSSNSQRQQLLQRGTSSTSQRQQQLQRQMSVDSDAMEEYTSAGQRPSRQRSSSNQSASQMNWILRAELSTSLKRPDRRSKPNLYTNAPEMNVSATATATAANNAGATPSRKTSVNSNASDGELSIPYVDVLTPIPDLPSDSNSQHYDNFESVFNTNGHPGTDQSPDQTWDSCDNVYCNTQELPPPYDAHDLVNDLNNFDDTDKKENVYSLEKIVPSVPRQQTSTEDGGEHLGAVGNQNDTLYVNVHVSSSQSDVRPGTGDGGQGESELYGNIAFGLTGASNTAVMSVSKDNPTYSGSNTSLNKIVLSVKQDSGIASGGGGDGTGVGGSRRGTGGGGAGGPRYDGSGVRSGGGQSSNIYDVPPPSEPKTRKESTSHDAYINLSDVQMTSQNGARKESKASITLTNSPTRPLARMDSVNGKTDAMATTCITAVIPVDKSQQAGGVNPLYDTPRTPRKTKNPLI